MTVKELAVLYALNSLGVVGDEIGYMENGHVPASTITHYIRGGFKLPGQTWEGLTGPIGGLDRRWRPQKQEIVNILSELRGHGRSVFSRRRKENPTISVMERVGKPNLYALNKAGVGVLCS